MRNARDTSSCAHSDARFRSKGARERGREGEGEPAGETGERETGEKGRQVKGFRFRV
jgi:hypothetical protein